MKYLSILAILFSTAAQAEKLEMDCYVNNLERCEGCDSLKITHDSKTGLYELIVHNMSADPSTDFGKPHSLKNLSIVTYGTKGIAGIKVSGSVTKELRKAYEFKGIENFLGSMARVTLKVVPNTTNPKLPAYIGTVHYKVAGITLFTEKAECYGWDPSEEGQE